MSARAKQTKNLPSSRVWENGLLSNDGSVEVVMTIEVSLGAPVKSDGNS